MDYGSSSGLYNVPYRLHHMIVVQSDLEDAYDWCLEQFGEESNRCTRDLGRGLCIVHDGRWRFVSPTMFFFRYENDAFAFKMRWG